MSCWIKPLAAKGRAVAARGCNFDRVSLTPRVRPRPSPWAKRGANKGPEPPSLVPVPLPFLGGILSRIQQETVAKPRLSGVTTTRAAENVRELPADPGDIPVRQGRLTSSEPTIGWLP